MSGKKLFVERGLKGDWRAVVIVEMDCQECACSEGCSTNSDSCINVSCRVKVVEWKLAKPSLPLFIYGIELVPFDTKFVFYQCFQGLVKVTPFEAGGLAIHMFGPHPAFVRIFNLLESISRFLRLDLEPKRCPVRIFGALRTRALAQEEMAPGYAHHRHLSCRVHDLSKGFELGSNRERKLDVIGKTGYGIQDRVVGRETSRCWVDIIKERIFSVVENREIKIFII